MQFRAVVRTLALAALAWLLPTSAMAAPDTGDTAEDALSVGRRIYRDGILPSGQPLRGIGPAQVVLEGRQAACATCHRRSGYGSSEGPIEVRPITGPSLFGTPLARPLAIVADAMPAATDAPRAPQQPPSAAEAARDVAAALRSARRGALAGARVRPSYDDRTLPRALREGLDASGHAFDPAMPRYALADADIETLTAYLKTLSTHTSPGVTGDTVHFATVIQPGTPPAEREALVSVLQAFLEDRNASQRKEARREGAGIVRLERTVRNWALHVWDLQGPSDSWVRQLQARYDAQPVFALLGGLGHAGWQPIHDFSERLELPCVFPQAEVPGSSGPDFYTVYLSEGIALEARALAQHLRSRARSGGILQIRGDDDAGQAAADAFREAWSAAAEAGPLVERMLAGPADDAAWDRILQESRARTLVLWLRPPHLAGVRRALRRNADVEAVYASATLAAGDAEAMLAADQRVQLVHPEELPSLRDAKTDAVRRWLRGKGLSSPHEAVQMNAYLAATVVGMGMSHNVDVYSREFLVEFIEHRLGTAIEASRYPRLSLGPGQRHASKGSYIVRAGAGASLPLQPVSDWIVP